MGYNTKRLCKYTSKIFSFKNSSPTMSLVPDKLNSHSFFGQFLESLLLGNSIVIRNSGMTFHNRFALLDALIRIPIVTFA